MFLKSYHFEIRYQHLWWYFRRVRRKFFDFVHSVPSFGQKGSKLSFSVQWTEKAWYHPKIWLWHSRQYYETAGQIFFDFVNLVPSIGKKRFFSEIFEHLIYIHLNDFLVFFVDLEIFWFLFLGVWPESHLDLEHFWKLFFLISFWFFHLTSQLQICFFFVLSIAENFDFIYSLTFRVPICNWETYRWRKRRRTRS